MYKKIGIKKTKVLKSKKGFSLMELLVGSFLVVFLTLASTSMLSFIKEKGKAIEMKASSKTQAEWLNRFIYKLIAVSNIDISYGVLNIPDDNNKNFLDFYPDYHSFQLSAADKKRTLTLTNGKKLVLLSGKGKSRRLNLMNLFDYYYSKLLVTVSAREAYFNDCYLRQELNPLWENNGLVLLSVPVFLRRSLPVNMKHFPKKQAFLASMDGTAYRYTCRKKQAHSTSFNLASYRKLIASSGSIFSFNNPAPGGTPYVNIKDFVLKSHLIAGQDVVIAARVNVLILAMANNKIYQCIISTKSAALTCDENNGLLFAENIDYVKFEREDVSSTQIKISFEFLE